MAKVCLESRWLAERIASHPRDDRLNHFKVSDFALHCLLLLEPRARPLRTSRFGKRAHQPAGASTTDVMLAGNWKTGRMVAP